MDELDGAVLRAWARSATVALELARPRIDAVNVFPVADGDTGTNVLLTVAAGAAAVDALDEGADAHAVASAFADGTLLHARGNSGVIVSQYARGLADGLGDPAAGASGAVVLAGALGRAARAARTAVAEPQEGTVLTLADVVAQDAREAADAGADLVTTLHGAVGRGHGALARISAEHPVLRRAHVPDAGACALLVVLDALVRVVRGEPEPATPPSWLPERAAPAHEVAAGGGLFEVMLLVRASTAEVGAGPGPGSDLGAELRPRMSEVGDSVAVVGGAGLWHVHVHTDHPADAIDRAALGRREQVLVRLVDGPHASEHVGDVPLTTRRWGLVVCTAAPALAGWYASAGAVTVVRCPESPVTAEHLVRAVEDTRAASVALLPGASVAVDDLARAITYPGAVVEVVDADDELRVAVAVLALAESTAAPGVQAAVQALGRLRVTELEDLGDLEAAVGTLVSGAGRQATAGPAGAGPGAEAAVDGSVTVLHRSPVDAGTADRLEAALARFSPGTEAVFVGPTGYGPALVLGLD